MPPPKRKRPAARATEPRANFENTRNHPRRQRGDRAPWQGWPIGIRLTEAEARAMLSRAAGVRVLSLCESPPSLNDLLERRLLIVVKVRTGVRGALACQRIGEFIELGATVVLVALDFDAARLLDKIARRAQLRFTTVAGSG